MYLKNELYCNSVITNTITGKFFPKKSDYLDISILRNNELIIYDGESLSKNQQFFINFKFKYTCIDLWKYSIYNNYFDFIIIIDSKYNLYLLSIREINEPHSNYNCENYNDSFIYNENIQINNSEHIDSKYLKNFYIKKETTISLIDKNYTNTIPNIIRIQKTELEKTNPINNYQFITNLIFNYDSYSGFITISIHKNQIMFINPIISWSKENYIESIILKILSNHLIYFNTSEYQLLNYTLINDYFKKYTKLFILLLNLNNFSIYYQFIIPDWENILKSSFNIQDHHFQPIYKTQPTLINISYIKNNDKNINYSNMFVININNNIDNDKMHVDNDISNNYSNNNGNNINNCNNLNISDMQKTDYYNIQIDNVNYNNNNYHYIILTFDYFNNIIIILYIHLVYPLNIYNQQCFFNIKNLSTKYIYLNQYFNKKLILNLKDIIIIENNYIINQKQNIKLLLSSKCKELFTINIQIQNHQIINIELNKILYENYGVDIPNICNISYFINMKKIQNFIISSNIGIVKNFQFINLIQKDLIIPSNMEIIYIKDSKFVKDLNHCKFIIIGNRYIWKNNILKNKYDWEINSIFRSYDLNSLKINYLINSSYKKNHIVKLFNITINENYYLIFYSKSFKTEIDLFIYNYYINNSNYFFNLNINGFYYNEPLLLFISVGNDLFIQVTNNRIILFSDILNHLKYIYDNKIIHNCSSYFINTKNKCIWLKSNYLDEIMYASKIDQNHLLFITQNQQIIKIKIETFDQIEIKNITSLNTKEIISSFDSKIICNYSNYELLILIGNCNNQISCIYIIENNIFLNNISLENYIHSYQIENGIITSIYIDINLNNIYIINNMNKLYIYDLKKMIIFIKNKQDIILPKSIVSINEYFNEIQENIEWKFICNYYNYIINQILYYQIIISSLSIQLYIELFEYKGKILNIKIKKLNLPEFSILSSLNTNNFKKLLYINGYSKYINIIEINHDFYQYFDVILPINNEIELMDKMIYFKNHEKLIINTFYKKNYICNNENDYTSQIILLNIDGYIYGSKKYYTKDIKIIPKTIFQFDNNKFFQIILFYNYNNNNKELLFSKIKLFSILNKNKLYKKNQFIELGEYILNGLKVKFILKHPKYLNTFVFILNKKNMFNNKLNYSIIKLYEYINKDDIYLYKDNKNIIEISNEIVFLNKYYIKIDHLIESAEFINDKIMKIKLTSHLNKYIYLNINKNSIKINEENYIKDQINIIQEHILYNKNILSFNIDSLFDNKNIELLLILKNNIINNHSILISLILSKEAKLFIFGLLTITRYLYKINDNNVCKIPAKIINILFKIFDLIINHDYDLNKNIGFKKIKINENKLDNHKDNNLNDNNLNKNNISNDINNNIHMDNINNINMNLNNDINDHINNNNNLNNNNNNNNNKKRYLFELNYFNIPKENNILFKKFNIDNILSNIDINIEENYILLYKKSCNACFKWKLFMITILWWNILYCQERIIKKLICPIIKNWSIEIKLKTENLLDKSFIYKELFNKDIIECFMVGSVIIDDILNKL